MDTHSGLVEIVFPNGHPARVLIPAPGTNPAQMLQALGIERPKALILVAGGAGRLDRAMEADGALRERLSELFSQGVACAAVDAGALIIDGGTESGVMALMGKGVAGCGYQTALLGVTPVGRATYPGGPEAGSIENGGPLDPHHSHFVLVGENWGDETKTMYALAAALVGGADPIPVVTVVAHGTDIARNEAMENVQRGWPILALEGSGGLADELARLKRAQGQRGLKAYWRWISRLWRRKRDRVMDQIVEQGRIEILRATSTPDDLSQLIGHYLSSQQT